MEKSELSETNLSSTEIYQESNSEVCIVVKSLNITFNEDKISIERGIERMMNLRHPCIAGVIGVVLSSPLRVVSIIRKHIDGYSLSKVVLRSPEWWTPTAKAKAVVGVLLGLRFAHSLGLVHGHLTGKNVFITEEGMIQISDFSLHKLFNEENDQWMAMDFYDFSRESIMATADVGAFARLLSEIVLGASCDGSGHAGEIPSFVLEIIERRDDSDLKTVDPFTAILMILKQNDFKIVEGVDTDEVSKFADLIQLSERLPD
jgi:serine/threonine protein kinase